MPKSHYLFDYISTEQLKSMIKQHYDRINKLEDQKYDLEYVVKRKDIEVHTKHMQRHMKSIEKIKNNISTNGVKLLGKNFSV